MNSHAQNFCRLGRIGPRKAHQGRCSGTAFPRSITLAPHSPPRFINGPQQGQKPVILTLNFFQPRLRGFPAERVIGPSLGRVTRVFGFSSLVYEASSRRGLQPDRGDGHEPALKDGPITAARKAP